MRKREFLVELSKYLKNKTVQERRDIISYYDELITDRMEHGEYEEDVINGFGPISQVLQTLEADIENSEYDDPVRNKFVEDRDKKKKKHRRVGKVFLILTMIIWVPILIILIVTLGVLFLSISLSGIILIIVGIMSALVTIPAFSENLNAALFQLGVGIGEVGAGVLLLLVISPIVINLTKAFLSTVGFNFRKGTKK